MLSGKHQGVGDAVERDCQTASLAAKHLFVVLQLFFEFLKCGHGFFPLKKISAVQWVLG